MISGSLKADTRSAVTLFQPLPSGWPSIDQTKMGLPSLFARLRASQREVIHGIRCQRFSSALGWIRAQVVLHALLKPNKSESSDGKREELSSVRSAAQPIECGTSPIAKKRHTAAGNLCFLISTILLVGADGRHLGSIAPSPDLPTPMRERNH